MPVSVSSAIGVYPYGNVLFSSIMGHSRSLQQGRRFRAMDAVRCYFGAASCVSDDRRSPPGDFDHCPFSTTRSAVRPAPPEECDDLTPLAL
jgi:hypothetical protein